MQTSRRSAIKTLAASALTTSSISSFAAMEPTGTPLALKGRIKQSVCYWCYRHIPFEDFCKDVKAIGLTAVDLTGPAQWPILKKHGLTCSLAEGAGKGIDNGFNDPKFHDELVASYEDFFPKLKAAGLTHVICFSGNRRGMSDEQGMDNCVKGLKRLMSSAEKHGVTMIMELLNSKVNHKDYMCDHSGWGAEMCQRIGSDNIKLLYDIYHMQIMEGDIIRNIRDHNKYIGHYHTGGNPGRNELDDTQEIYYPAVMKAIVDTGYKGYVGQEFIPKVEANALQSLRKCVEICDV